MATQNLDWMSQALCATELWFDAWFPEGAVGGRQEEVYALTEAKKVCQRCPVRVECYTAGLTETVGVWGGVLKHPRDVPRRTSERQEGVASLGSRRRLQALVGMGYHPRDVLENIKRYSGIRFPREEFFAALDEDCGSVTEGMAEQISRAYKRMMNNLATGQRANDMLAKAKENGWPTPRRWHGLDIDNAEEYPR